MSWHYLPEAAVDYTQVCCSDTLPFAPLKSSQPTEECCCNASLTASFQRSRSGTMCAPSTANFGKAKSTLSAAVSPARTSAQQEPAPVYQAHVQDSGMKWPGSLAKYDPNTHSLKTAQRSLFEDSSASSVTLPRWGTMRNGVLWERTTSAHLTNGNVSGLLPTISATDVKGKSGAGHIERHGQKRLSDAVVHPTPTKSAALGGPGRGKNRTGGDNLRTMIANQFATPSASDATRGGTGITLNMTGQSLRQQIGGRMNPIFVEWLMGWPIGSTAFSPLAMDKYQEWQQQHGQF